MNDKDYLKNKFAEENIEEQVTDNGGESLAEDILEDMWNKSLEEEIKKLDF